MIEKSSLSFFSNLLSRRVLFHSATLSVSLALFSFSKSDNLTFWILDSTYIYIYDLHHNFVQILKNARKSTQRCASKTVEIVETVETVKTVKTARTARTACIACTACHIFIMNPEISHTLTL